MPFQKFMDSVSDNDLITVQSAVDVVALVNSVSFRTVAATVNNSFKSDQNINGRLCIGGW